MENPKKYTSSVENSPFLDGDEVEVKAYSINQFNQQSTFKQTQAPPPPPPKGDSPGGSSSGPQTNSHGGAQYTDPYAGDPMDPMSFNEPGNIGSDIKDEPKEQEIPKSTMDRAGTILALYSSIVPEILGDMSKMDVHKIKTVLSENKQIPANKVHEMEEFLKLSNKEIEEAFHFTPEQAQILKDAIAEVLNYYKLRPGHPLANLLFAIVPVALMQFFTVRALKKQRDEHLIAFIEEFKVVAPPGMETAFKKGKKRLLRRVDEEKAAA